jgi:hypothetical protein
VRWLKDWGAERDITFGDHFWPHDGDRESLWLEGGTLGVAEKQGIRPRTVQRPVNKVEAIGTARAMFPRCQFDEAGCSVGLKRLRAYRKEWDERSGVWKDRPRHDEASHGADAFLTFACSNVSDEDSLRRAGLDRWRKGRRELLGIV